MQYKHKIYNDIKRKLNKNYKNVLTNQESGGIIISSKENEKK